MKTRTLLTIGFTFFATTSFAQPLTRLTFGAHNPNGDSTNSLVIAVSVNDDHFAVARIKDRAGSLDLEVKQEVGSVLFGAIKNKVTTLAGTDLQTTHTVIRCMVMRLLVDDVLEVARGYVSSTDSFSGIATVLTSRGCWIGTEVTPVALNAREDAIDLRGSLRALGLSLASEVL